MNRPLSGIQRSSIYLKLQSGVLRKNGLSLKIWISTAPRSVLPSKPLPQRSLTCTSEMTLRYVSLFSLSIQFFLHCFSLSVFFFLLFDVGSGQAFFSSGVVVVCSPPLFTLPAAYAQEWLTLYRQLTYILFYWPMIVTILANITKKIITDYNFNGHKSTIQIDWWETEGQDWCQSSCQRKSFWQYDKMLFWSWRAGVFHHTYM